MHRSPLDLEPLSDARPTPVENQQEYADCKPTSSLQTADEEFSLVDDFRRQMIVQLDE